MTRTIKIPIDDGYLKCKHFSEDYQYSALKKCEDSRLYDAAFMPDLINFRTVSNKDSDIWKLRFATSSAVVTGKTSKGHTVDIVSHIPNYFSSVDYLEQSLNPNTIGTLGTLLLEFDNLLKLEDNKNVFVLDHLNRKRPIGGVYALSDFEKDSLFINMLGGKDVAEKYFPVHKSICGDKIRMFLPEKIGLKSVPSSSILYAGNINEGGAILANRHADDAARFLGVPKKDISPLEKHALTMYNHIRDFKIKF